MYGRREVCERCGKRFSEQWPRGDKQFCSNACRQAAYRERKWQERAKALKKARTKPRRKKATRKRRRVT